MDSSEDLSLAALATVTASAVSQTRCRSSCGTTSTTLLSGCRTPIDRPPGSAAGVGNRRGETVIFSAIAYGASRKAKRALVAVHRRELLRQAISKLSLAGVTPGIIAGQVNPHPEALVTVASIQTLTRRSR